MDFEREVLPPLFDGWLDAAGISPIPREAKATCASCAMCTTDGPAAAAETFRPDSKCCTFVPELRNFLVGDILAGDTAAAARGRESVRERIRRRLATSPLGLSPPPVYALLYRATQEKGENTFGRSLAMRCPHFVDEAGGQCGIWQHRNSVCATFFCKHNRGAVGQRFWNDVRQLLNCIETEVAFWCAMEAGVSSSALRRLLATRAGAPVMPMRAELVDEELEKRAREVWGAWFGREEEYFLACGERARSLSWDDILRIGGSQLDAWLRVAAASFADLRSTALPGRAAANRVAMRPYGATASIADSYSRFDSLVIPRELLDLLHHFDGRPTSEALAEIAATEKVELDDELVRMLVDYQVLTDLA